MGFVAWLWQTGGQLNVASDALILRDIMNQKTVDRSPQEMLRDAFQLFDEGKLREEIGRASCRERV